MLAGSLIDGRGGESGESLERPLSSSRGTYHLFHIGRFYGPAHVGCIAHFIHVLDGVELVMKDGVVVKGCAAAPP